MRRWGFAVTAALLALVLATVAFAQDVQDEDPKQEMKQLRLRLQKYSDAAPDAHGGINRRGAEYAMDGGPHGPMGPGPDEEGDLDDATLFFVDGVEEAPAGQLNQHRFGPGDGELDPPCGAFGPNYDGDGFGPGGDGSGEGEPSDLGSRAQNRSGRR